MYLFVFLVALLGTSYCDDADGGKAARLPLNDGNSIPAIGLGTFLGSEEYCVDIDGGNAPEGTAEDGQNAAKDQDVENAVTYALNAGYRLINTASAYCNEDQIGDALRKTTVPREKIFIVTNLSVKEKRDVVGALRMSLRRLNQTYVDLYLIQNPVSLTPDETAFEVIDYLDTWKGMEEAKRLGLARSIGVSNFNISQMDRLLEHCDIKPSVLQIEVNLNLAQNKLVEYCKNHNIVIMAYTPFGSLFKHDSLAPAPRANDPALVEIAQKYGKTTPQVVLKYLVQRGLVPIPRSAYKDRIEENINIFDFALSKEDMETLSKYNKDYRVINPSFWQDHPYYPFEKVDIPLPSIFKNSDVPSS